MAKSDAKEAIESNETINKTLEIPKKQNIWNCANKTCIKLSNDLQRQKVNFVQLSANDAATDFWSVFPTLILSHDYYAFAACFCFCLRASPKILIDSDSKSLNFLDLVSLIS